MIASFKNILDRDVKFDGKSSQCNKNDVFSLKTPNSVEMCRDFLIVRVMQKFCHGR